MDKKGDDAVYIYDASKDTTNRISTTPVALHSCGDQCPKQESIILRPNGRMDWHIIYIMEGECAAKYGDQTYHLSAKDFILYPPNTPQDYRYPGVIPTHAFWLHFGGTDIERALREGGLSGGVFHCRQNGDLPSLVHSLTHEYRIKQPLWEIRGAGLLLQFLAELGRAINPDQKMDDFVAALVERILIDPASDINIDAYAQKCGFSRSHFDCLFRTQVGMPPHQYLLGQRLKEASWLLRHTALPVSEIAAQVGFADAFYFSRLYKKKYGVSPKETRMENIPQERKHTL